MPIRAKRSRFSLENIWDIHGNKGKLYEKRGSSPRIRESLAEDDLKDLGFHLKWNMGFSYDALSFFGSSFKDRPHLETFGWKRLAWLLVESYFLLAAFGSPSLSLSSFIVFIIGYYRFLGLLSNWKLCPNPACCNNIHDIHDVSEVSVSPIFKLLIYSPFESSQFTNQYIIPNVKFLCMTKLPFKLLPVGIHDCRFLNYAYNERCLDTKTLLWLPCCVSLLMARWVLPFSHDNVQRQSLVDQMAEDKNVGEIGEDVRYAQLRVLLLSLVKTFLKHRRRVEQLQHGSWVVQVGVCTTCLSIMITCSWTGNSAGQTTYLEPAWWLLCACLWDMGPRYQIGMLGRPLLFMGAEIGHLALHAESQICNILQHFPCALLSFVVYVVYIVYVCVLIRYKQPAASNMRPTAWCVFLLEICNSTIGYGSKVLVGCPININKPTSTQTETNCSRWVLVIHGTNWLGDRIAWPSKEAAAWHSKHLETAFRRCRTRLFWEGGECWSRFFGVQQEVGMEATLKHTEIQYIQVNCFWCFLAKQRRHFFQFVRLCIFPRLCLDSFDADCRLKRWVAKLLKSLGDCLASSYDQITWIRLSIPRYTALEIAVSSFSLVVVCW